MDKQLVTFVTKLKRFVLLLPFIFCSSCNEDWTPQADGYFMVNDKRYNVHIMAIYRETFPGQGYKNTEVILQGAPYVNVSMFVSTPSITLDAGSYHVSYGYEPMGINSLDVRWSSMNELQKDRDSQGNMTVAKSGNNYVLDFDGTIQGRTIKIHYSGLVSQQ